MAARCSALAILLVACGGTPTRAEPDPRVEAMARQLQALDQRVDQLEGALAQAHGRLNRAEQRLGYRPFTPSTLTAARGIRLELGKAFHLRSRRGKAKKRSLANYVADGRGAVFAFWATWCKPCIADGELVHLRELQHRLGRDFPLISVACDGVDKVKAHAKADRWIYPMWQLDDGHLSMLPRRFIQQNGLGLPLFVVTDGRGQASWFRNAPLDDTVVEELITAARR